MISFEGLKRARKGYRLNALYRPEVTRNRGQGPLDSIQNPKPPEPACYRPQMQRLIHHPRALPISAVFGLRYVHTLVRKWAASGAYDGRVPEVGMRPVEW